MQHTMLCRRLLATTGSVISRSMSYVKRGDPDMTKDNLFDENFEVRKQVSKYFCFSFNYISNDYSVVAV